MDEDLKIQGENFIMGVMMEYHQYKEEVTNEKRKNDK